MRDPRRRHDLAGDRLRRRRAGRARATPRSSPRSRARSPSSASTSRAQALGRQLGVGHDHRRAGVAPSSARCRSGGRRWRADTGRGSPGARARRPRRPSRRRARRRGRAASSASPKRVDVRPQVVAPAPGTRGAQRVVVAPPGGVQHAVRRVGERLDRRLVDRPRAERAAEDEHAALARRAEAEPRAGGGAVGRRRRHRPPGDEVLVARRGPRAGTRGRPAARTARAAGWRRPRWLSASVSTSGIRRAHRRQARPARRRSRRRPARRRRRSSRRIRARRAPSPAPPARPRRAAATGFVRLRPADARSAAARSRRRGRARPRPARRRRRRPRRPQPAARRPPPAPARRAPPSRPAAITTRMAIARETRHGAHDAAAARRSRRSAAAPSTASSTSSDDEPDEMNGSGTPVSGARPSTVKTLSSAWQRISDVSPAREQLRVGAARRLARARSPA